MLALLIVDGVLTGAVGLAFTPLYLGAVPAPLGVLLSVLVLPWLVLRAGEIDRRFAGAPIFAWFVTVAVLGLAGPGGDALLTARGSRCCWSSAGSGRGCGRCAGCGGPDPAAVIAGSAQMRPDVAASRAER